MRAVENDSYSKGSSDYSVTELLKPPRATALEKLHKDKLSDDVEDRLWSLYGQIVHTILERANEADLVEKRFFADFGGKTVSAQVDSLSLKDGILTDWKFTTSWSFKPGKPPKPDYVAQLNMQLELLRRNGLDAQSLRIVGLLRDWSIMEANRTDDYPKKGVAVQPIEMWSRDRTTAFIEQRIAMHEAARAAKSDDELPLCDKEDRWAKDDTWAVVKGDRAIRFGVCFSEQQAKEIHSKNPGTQIQFRAGVSTKCELYCSVSDYCSQFKKSKGGK